MSVRNFMQKTEFRAKMVKVAKSKFGVEQDRGKKTKADVVAKAVMGETFNPFFDQARFYLRYEVKELLKHPSRKSDLVVELAGFVYSVLFHLAKPQAIDCYRYVFQSFSSRGWFSRELRISTWMICEGCQAHLLRLRWYWPCCWGHGFFQVVLPRITPEGICFPCLKTVLFVFGSWCLEFECSWTGIRSNWRCEWGLVVYHWAISGILFF